jgi:acyl carrier protein
MPAAALEDKLLQVLSSILNVPRESLSLDSSRKTVEAWDSLKHMYVMLALEEEFRIQFNDREIASLDTVSSLAEAIMVKTGRSAD